MWRNIYQNLSFAKFFPLHPSFAPLPISIEQKCSNNFFSETSHAMKKLVSQVVMMTNSDTKEPKAKVNTRILACKVNFNQKRPWQIIEVERWVLRFFILKFRKGPIFLRWKKQVHGKVAFYTKRKIGNHGYCSGVLDCVNLPADFGVLGDQVVVATLAEQRIADIQTNYTMQHFISSTTTSPSIFNPKHFASKQTLLNCHFECTFGNSTTSSRTQNLFFFGCRLLWLRSFELLSTFVDHVNFCFGRCPARSTRNSRFKSQPTLLSQLSRKLIFFFPRF